MRSTWLTRRRVLAASFIAGGIAASGLAAVRSTPALAALRIATPRQTPGPFYPATKPLDQDSNLMVVDGRPGRARGTPLHLMGRVIDRDGRPQPGAVVEIWQANAHGRYHPARDPRGVPLDPNFQGWGRDRADADGTYRFLTIVPPPYPASATWTRPAHIHFAVHGPGFERLVTQMYFAGDPHLARDFVLNAIADPAARASVVVTLAPPSPNLQPAAQLATFDIVLG